jgi:hypothetical protein
MPESIPPIISRRLRGTLLIQSHHTRAAEVVRALGAVQSQDYAGAKWALGMRVRGSTDASIEREFDAGRILRTHVLRPTWHFVVPEDIRWMLALTGPRVNRTMGYYNDVFELDAKVFARSHAVMERALGGGNSLTRQELRAQLEPKIGPTPGMRLARVVMEAECTGLICSGPMRGKQFTYALLDERARPTKPFDRDDALRELSLRYFRTRGPATPQDFAWWSGLTVADANRAIDINGKALEPLDIGGRRYWSAAGARDAKLLASAHLLPNYDEYFIGYKDRSAIGQRLRSVKAVTGGSALIAHVIAVNGQLVGGWKRIAGKVVLNPIAKLTAAERKLVDAELKKLNAFVGAAGAGASTTAP